MNRTSLTVVMLFAFLAAGCGSKLRLEETIPLPAVGKVYEIDAIKSEQKVKISIQASEAPVDLYVYTGKNQDAAERSGFSNAALLLARERNKDSIDVIVDVPANEKLFVNLQRASAKAPKEVKVKISN